MLNFFSIQTKKKDAAINTSIHIRQLALKKKQSKGNIVLREMKFLWIKSTKISDIFIPVNSTKRMLTCIIMKARKFVLLIIGSRRSWPCTARSEKSIRVRSDESAFACLSYLHSSF